MPDYTSLLTHYDYWDSFVEKWRDGEFGRDTHLPEPWWGWCPEDGPLYSVTVNLSPGLGGKLQTQQCINCAAGCLNRAYSHMMFDGTLRNHLRNTELWHLNRRHIPLMRAIGKESPGWSPDTRHHLSVELRPFHNPISNAIYLEQYRKEIIHHSLLFAAEASKHIERPKDVPRELSLRNIVIVRAALSKVKQLAGGDVCEKGSLEVLKSVSVFTLNPDNFKKASDVFFVCISGARNHLLNRKDLKEIIIKMNNHINK